ncbi:MAG: phosphopyruvate hydratase [Desulfurococcales archaeon]|nr:phosphopyruvate hydratase [Desulfurococcales archaeon]
MYTIINVADELFKIKSVKARQIIDSRGNPTIQVIVVTEGGGVGIASAPSGASTGKHEAVELRDGEKIFHGKSVLRAVENVNKIIASALKGMDSRRQREIDYKMIKLDGTPNKSRLGGNAIVATSLAVAKSAASTYDMPLYMYLGGARARTLPVPMLNIINGGVHAGNKLDFQEFMIVPGGFSSFSEALRAAVEAYHELKKILKEKYGLSAINVGDEGGYAPPMEKIREALDTLIEAIKKAGYVPGQDIAIALDVASSQFYDVDKKVYVVEGKEFAPQDLLELYLRLVDEYPIVSIEDPFYEEDFDMFAEATRALGSKILIVGDDLFTTNPNRLLTGIKKGAGNAVLVKVNQVGTLSETMDVVYTAHRSGYRAIISHRSGETEDTTISDLAVGFETGLIKTGAPARGERTAKYNRLLFIEEELDDPYYPGFKVFPGKPK